MKIAMSDAEITLLEAVLKPTRRYLEYGCGGSTIFALNHVDHVASVDSHPEWIENVRKEAGADDRLDIRFADIGPVKDWGYPMDDAPREKLDNYLLASKDLIANRDFVFVDGRFRVACFAYAYVNGHTGPIGLHDYRSRNWFHVVETFADPIAEAEDFTVFLPRDRKVAQQVLERYRYEPA